MNVQELLHMNGGAGNNSYASNSMLQKKAILKIKPLLEDAFGELCRSGFSKKLVMADLGCSSGPNTFLVVSQAIRIIKSYCEALGFRNPPEMQFFLNDLPGNDFNNIFRSLKSAFEKENFKDENLTCFVAGLPGSFYERLFPRETVHFFHSSYSLMWISQVPKGLDQITKRKDATVNKNSIYISKTSPPQVVKLYQDQFQKDFSLFLKLRFNELVSGGRMVLAFLGRKNKNILTGELSSLWSLVSEALNSMVLEGLVEEEKVDSFNLPFYAPSMEEVEAVIIEQGFFDILQFKMLESNWDPDNSDDDDDDDDDIVCDNIQRGANFALCIRAVLEPMIAGHFGELIIEEMFSRFSSNVARHLLKERAKLPVLVLALKKKD